MTDERPEEQCYRSIHHPPHNWEMTVIDNKNFGELIAEHGFAKAKELWYGEPDRKTEQALFCPGVTGPSRS